MKKIISLVLTLCVLFVTVNFVWSGDRRLTDANDGPILQIYTVSEFASKLESEDVNIYDAEAYNVCILIELQDSLSGSWDFDISNVTATNEGIEEALREHRDNVKEYYTAYNEEVIVAAGLDKYDYHLSFYSPYIEIVFDDLAEYEIHENELLASIRNTEMVSCASSYAIIEDKCIEATIGDTGYSIDYPLQDAFGDIGVLNSSYTGNGVKVGIIDGNVPYITSNLKMGNYTIVEGGTDGLHSTVITSIIGGNSGIAENVEFYCMEETDNLIDDCNLMIDTYNVNIINMSLWDAKVGYYSNYDACIDNIVSNTKCSFVKSAGNEGLGNKFVTAPGCAMNAITVGSINGDHDVSYFSSWNVNEDFLFKPDIVAPGQGLEGIPNIADQEGGHNGTSYAAPMVVGTIALLMEEFPMLKINPALVKSVVHLGAEKLPSQTGYFDEQAGFGLINYPNMRECLLHTNFYNFNILPTADEGDVVLSYTVAIPSLHRAYINANTMVNSSNTTEDDMPTVPAYTNYTIKVYDLEASTYVASSTLNSSVDYLSFLNESLTNSSFRIDIVLEADNASGQTEAGAIAYRVEDHQYDDCVSLNATSHQKTCECGESIIEEHVKVHIPCNNDSYHLVRCACGYQANSPHVVNPTSLKRAPCILCGAMVTIGNNTMQPWGNDCEESPY